MIVIVDNKKIEYEFRFNQKEGDLLQELIDCFIDQYGSDAFESPSMIAIRHGNFFYIIKNIYGNLSGGMLLSNFSEEINTHLNI